LDAEVADLRVAVKEQRSRLREEEAHFSAPGVSEKHRAHLALLAKAEESFAAESGRWPPDEPTLARARSERDSLLASVAAVLAPVDLLVAEVDSLNALVVNRREERRRLTAERDSVLGERERITSRVSLANAALRKLRARRPGIREIVSSDGVDVARCPTCHGALGDTPATHPEMVATEAFVDAPCTVCHRGSGRALDVERAHLGLLAGAGRGVGKYSLQARIDRLQSEDPKVRREAIDELRRVTGIEPPALETSEDNVAAGEVRAWLAWWEVARRYFEVSDVSDLATLSPGSSDFDYGSYSTSGRPLRYVGSRECLGCHRTTHREHSERWLETKFKSLDRLKAEANPRPCYRCHVTGYDERTDQYAEAGVTCEACHGPGEIYSEMMFAGAELNGRGQTGRGRELLDSASRMARDAASARTKQGDSGPISLCVSCHHPRRHLDGGPSILERKVEARAVAIDSLVVPEGKE
jgi:hypothetical protein